MICNFCGRDFPEHLIEESHDIPCYLFEGNRKGRKNQADKCGRHNLCKECHELYEKNLRIFLRLEALEFSRKYFKERGENDT